MLNKILLRRIKSFLSLRGAKRRSNRSGFSLIELMVAVAILAMAIFGIFHAYSAGFMGMADARDRTVATNYAREAMEDIKNKDFDQIITQSRNYIDGTKYEREVIVQSETNLKEVTTKVYWKDRNGTWKTVETDMLIHFIETTAGIPTRIMLIANPYNVLTEDDGDTTVYENRSIITAVVKDAKGNTVTTYNNNITFTLNDSNSSNLIDNSGSLVGKVYSVNAEQGIAIVTFQASEAEGDVTIEASDSELTSDSVTIKVTDLDKPVKINLTASPIFMTPESISIITATIVNAGGATVESATNEITFSVSDPDLGTLSNQSILDLGVATIDLNSTATKGTITITASASGLEPGVVDVITGGQISLSAFPSPVHNEEKSEITVTTKDVDGVPINYIGTIDLLITPYDDTIGFGNLSPEEFVEFNGDTYLERLTFTASSEGKVKITAIDASGILDQAEIILIINPVLIPHHINVSADPSSIEAGGAVFSTITAWVEDDDNTLITSYSIPIIFETNNGTFNNYGGPTESDELSVDENGMVTIKLYSSDTCGTAIITVSSLGLDDVTDEVDFYTDADHIKLVATPQNIQVGNVKFLLKAIMEDENNAKISNYNESVTFNISSDSLSIIKYQTSDTPSLTTTFSSGEVIINMRSVNEAGTATIHANSLGIFGSLNIPVGIALNLVNNSPSYDSSDNSVSFDIEILGAPLSLEEMQVSWQTIGVPPETLESIRINEIEVYFSSVISGTVIDIADNTTLPIGTSHVKMYFNTNMSGKSFTVIFNPNSGNYSVPITDPEIP